jgi:solute carrier family 25 aspartate/glutamate transporter 12/13
MATVTDKVQEVLVGTTEEPQLGQTERATFLKHAKKDENGENYLDEESFINAVAPESEDYVSIPRNVECQPDVNLTSQ